MSKIFTLKKLVAAVAKDTGLTQAAVANVFDATTKITKKQLKAGFVVKTQNGQIKIVSRKARKGVNPRTGKKITIPAAKKPKFTFCKSFKRDFKK